MEDDVGLARDRLQCLREFRIELVELLAKLRRVRLEPHRLIRRRHGQSLGNRSGNQFCVRGVEPDVPVVLSSVLGTLHWRRAVLLVAVAVSALRSGGLMRMILERFPGPQRMQRQARRRR